MRVEVGRQIGLLNAWLIDRGEVPTKEGSIAKVYVSELNAHFAGVGLDILGLAGQMGTNDETAPLHGKLQWLYTIAPMQRFGGGTNEIQRIIIAQRGLGSAEEVSHGPRPHRRAARHPAGARGVSSRRRSRASGAWTWDRTPEGHDAEFWRAVGELGWLGFAVPEAMGGQGASLLDLGILLEECGRAVAPFGIFAAVAAASPSTPSAPRRSVGRGSPPWRAASG